MLSQQQADVLLPIASAPIDRLNPYLVRLCELMWLLYRRDGSNTSNLVMPVDSRGVARVSEQESRVILCHLLDSSSLYYSVETPTRQKYQQSGQDKGTARTDLTVYGERDGRSARLVNIEFKAGLCPEEAFRKDLEKLVREQVPGVWFHTVEAASRRNLSALFEKVRNSFESLAHHLDGQDHPVGFVFCSLASPRAHVVELDLEGGAETVLRRVERVFSTESLESVSGPWASLEMNVDGAATLSTPECRYGSPATAAELGLRAKQLVKIHLQDGRTVVRVLTVRGTGYALHGYAEGAAFKYIDLRAGTIGELMALAPSELEVVHLSSPERRPSVRDIEHWTRVCGGHG